MDNRQRPPPPIPGRYTYVPLVARFSDFICLVPWLAHGGLLVMTSDIVPFDTVSVEIVQDTKTGLKHGYVII